METYKELLQYIADFVQVRVYTNKMLGSYIGDDTSYADFMYDFQLSYNVNLSDLKDVRDMTVDHFIRVAMERL
ncbi:hypothetical protein [Paenibacillus xylanexedens]|uniref:hypothetical protein n=1 Tax=Paenibacillus xylanexedens TaxID=528191 RepID=UPI0011A21F58|nr:hypothetical protein [Paenibacillus xylanexedens]